MASGEATVVTSAPNDSIDSFVSDCLKRLHIYRCHDQLQLLATVRKIKRQLDLESNRSLATDPSSLTTTTTTTTSRVQVLVIDSISAFYWLSKAQDNKVEPTSNHRIVHAIDRYQLTSIGLVPMHGDAGYRRRLVKEGDDRYVATTGS
jgi:hypothetical protein